MPRANDQETAPDAEESVELLRLARAGDASALDRLYRRHRPCLRRWAQGRLPRWARDAIDTEDLVQEILLHTVRRMESFEPKRDGALQAYLRRALDNRIRDEIRKVRRRPQGADLGEERRDLGASPLESAIGAEAARRYEEALERLREDDRELIVARVEMGLTFAEVARATSRPTADAARLAVGRALVRLAEEMDRN